MYRIVKYLMVLSLIWIPCSGHAQLNENPSSEVLKAEALAMTVQVAILHSTNLNDTTKMPTASEDKLIYDAEVEQHSDSEQTNQAKKKELKAPAQVALMIITLMLAVVVFITNVGDK